MTYNGEHLFLYLFAICVSSLRRCLLRSLAHFKIKFLIFLLLSFKSSLYILNSSLLLDISFFSQSVVSILILLNSVGIWCHFFFLVVLGKELLWVRCLNFLYYKWIGSYKHSWNQWAEGLEVCFTVYDIFEATQLTDKPQCYRKNV